MRWLAILAVLATGCLESKTKLCGNVTCSADAICDEVHGGCASQAQLDACAGVTDGTGCTIVVSDDGVCDASICIPTFCGDGLRLGGEACDGTSFAAVSNCQQLGYYDNVALGCKPTCDIDESVCTGWCGDDIVAAGIELCDGGDPTESCVNFGYGTGRLGCTQNCGPSFSECIAFGWQRIDMPEQAHWVHATSAQNVWVVGHNGMVRRFDGTTWSAVDVSVCTVDAIDEVFVLSATDAFIRSSNKVILVTASSCTSWTIDATVQGLWAASTTDAYIGSQTGLWHFTQGAWTSVPQLPLATMAVWGSGSDDVYAAQRNVADNSLPHELAHLDGGTWTTPQAVPGMKEIYAIWGTSRTDVYLGGMAVDGSQQPLGAAIKRGQFGAWTDFLANSPHVGVLSFAGFGMTTGGRTTTMLADFGTSAPISRILSRDRDGWIDLKAPVNFGRMVATDTGSIYSTGAGSKYIYHFDGSAVLETPLPPLQATEIVALHEDEAYALVPRFLSPSDLWAWNGVTWTREQTGTAHDLLAAQDGAYAVIGSRIKKRTAPNTWTDVTATNISGNQLAGTSSNDLWVSTGTTIKHWTGTLQTYTVSAVVSDVWAASPTFAVAVGVVGAIPTICQWNGSTWTCAASPTTETLDNVWGRGPTEVYAASSSELIRYNGTSWSKLPIQPPMTGISDVWAGGPDDIFVTGNEGLLRFDGQRWMPVETGGSFEARTIDGFGTTLYVATLDTVNIIVRMRPW